MTTPARATRTRTAPPSPRLGIGLGWRPEIDLAVERLEGLDWVEVVAENLCPDHLPQSVRALLDRGLTVVPHGVSLGLGGAEEPDPERVRALAERAEALNAPLVTEHLAFVRAARGTTTLEAGHLLPVPHTRDALEVVVKNVRAAQRDLPVPLALENIAALVGWPDEEMTEAQFLAELVERTGVRLLVDVANLHTNHVNLGTDPARELDRLPVEAIAYVHVAGGVLRDGVWHDTHAHPVTRPVLDVLAELCRRTEPRGVLLERDGAFPPPAELAAELKAIREVTATVRPEPAAPAEPEAQADPDGGTGARDITTTVRIAAGRRERLAAAQGALLEALVAGGPVPPGFDAERVAVQSRALLDKRCDVAAKVGDEPAAILGDGFRSAFAGYAKEHPMTGSARADVLAFVEDVLARPEAELSEEQRRALRTWLRGARGQFDGPLGRARRVWHRARSRGRG